MSDLPQGPSIDQVAHFRLSEFEEEEAAGGDRRTSKVVLRVEQARLRALRVRVAPSGEPLALEAQPAVDVLICTVPFPALGIPLSGKDTFSLEDAQGGWPWEQAGVAEPRVGVRRPRSGVGINLPHLAIQTASGLLDL